MTRSSGDIEKFGTLIGTSKRMKNVYALIEKAAKVDLPVLIMGETGTGKELVAREIHLRSQRTNKRFIAVNMSAIPSELLASELFGHEKGAFTGATSAREGRFQEAKGGTLFLDEILTMEDRVQVALLRVLEVGKFRRVGGTRDIKTDVRILASVNEDPLKAVKAKQFRIDLLHRLQVIRVHIPPLRRRKNDIPILVRHFLKDISMAYEHVSDSVSKEVLHILARHEWPGNVRELRNVLYHAAVSSEGGVIEPKHLPVHILDGANPSDLPQVPAKNTAFPAAQNATDDRPPLQEGIIWPQEGIFLPVGLSLNEVQKAYILKTLSLMGNNKTKAAQALGVSRKSLYDRLKRWNIPD